MRTRTQEVIRLIWARSRVTSLDIRRVISLGTSSVHRILRGLESEGYLQNVGRAPQQSMEGAITHPMVYLVTDRDRFYRDLILPEAPSPRPYQPPKKISGREKILAYVADTNHEFTAAMLADVGGITRGYAGQIITELEAAGTITRIADQKEFGVNYYIRTRKEKA